ncbi:MAG TPA: 6-phosphogluconolactonase, partial [Candidatus Acidoferrum sp.]
MLVVLKSNYEELSLEAARIVANSVRQNPSLRLGLATGSTTIGVYRELVRLHREESLDFSRVITFNLDEYLGISPDHAQSFHHFMSEHFFSHVNLDA